MDPQACFQPSEGIVCKHLPRQVVILELDSGEYFSLDDVGMLVWSLLDGRRSVAQIAEQVARDYDVPEEQAARDVGDLLEELERHKVVSRSSQS